MELTVVGTAASPDNQYDDRDDHESECAENSANNDCCGMGVAS